MRVINFLSYSIIESTFYVCLNTIQIIYIYLYSFVLKITVIMKNVSCCFIAQAVDRMKVLVFVIISFHKTGIRYVYKLSHFLQRPATRTNYCNIKIISNK